MQGCIARLNTDLAFKHASHLYLGLCGGILLHAYDSILHELTPFWPDFVGHATFQAPFHAPFHALACSLSGSLSFQHPFDAPFQLRPCSLSFPSPILNPRCHPCNSLHFPFHVPFQFHAPPDAALHSVTRSSPPTHSAGSKSKICNCNSACASTGKGPLRADTTRWAPEAQEKVA